MHRSLRNQLAIAACLACLSCQSVTSATAGLAGRTMLAFGSPETPPPSAAPVVTAALPTPPVVAIATPAPSATPSPARRSGGGGRRGPAPTPAPTLPPLPAVAQLEPLTATGTIGNPNDALTIDGLRFDPDFATNGKVHVAFSLVLDGQNVTDRIDPAQLKAALSTDAPAAPGNYRVAAFEGLEVRVDGLKAVGRPPLDATLVLDSSGSMGSTDPNRLRVAAVKKYITDMRPDDRVALTDFSSCEPPIATDPLANFTILRLLYPFGKDRDTAKAAVDSLAQCSNTPLYDAILEGIGYLNAQNGNRPRALIALSDGQNNASTHTIQDVIAAAKAANVLLMMLAFVDYDESALQGMVSGSEGYFLGAEDASTLDAQYSAAARTVAGNAQAIIYVPDDQRIANHMTGRLTATIDGKDYSATFNAATP